MPRIIYGIHPVEEALRRRASAVRAVLISRKSEQRSISSEAGKHGIPLTAISADELDALCAATSHQGVAAIVGDYPYLNLEQLLAQSARPALFVVADSLMDPQNLGSIIRSALVLGATGLVLPKDRSVSITPTVVRVSAGASESLPCARVTNLARALQELKEAGLWIAGTVEQGGTHPADAALAEPLALVLGNEQRGIRPLVLKQCDLRLTIPSRGAIASLNVAAAAAAFLYEIARQRRA